MLLRGTNPPPLLRRAARHVPPSSPRVLLLHSPRARCRRCGWRGISPRPSPPGPTPARERAVKANPCGGECLDFVSSSTRTPHGAMGPWGHGGCVVRAHGQTKSI